VSISCQRTHSGVVKERVDVAELSLDVLNASADVFVCGRGGGGGGGGGGTRRESFAPFASISSLTEPAFRAARRPARTQYSFANIRAKGAPKPGPTPKPRKWTAIRSAI